MVVAARPSLEFGIIIIDASNSPMSGSISSRDIADGDPTLFPDVKISQLSHSSVVLLACCKLLSLLS